MAKKVVFKVASRASRKYFFRFLGYSCSHAWKCYFVFESQKNSYVGIFPFAIESVH